MGFCLSQVLPFQSGQEVEKIAPWLIDFQIPFCSVCSTWNSEMKKAQHIHSGTYLVSAINRRFFWISQVKSQPFLVHVKRLILHVCILFLHDALYFVRLYITFVECKIT